MGWLLLLVACYQAAAQDVVPKRPVEIEALADRARALPPEFSADLHLKLAASPLIADVKWKRALIEEAFVNGARAPLPYRQRGDAFADSRPSREVESHDLEALTLQTRAVDAMLAFDPPRALELYQRITPPVLPSVPCTGIVTPNVAAWYETAARVFDRGFTAKQREKGDDMHLLRQRIGSMHSPSQVVPALRLILAAARPCEQRTGLVTRSAATRDRLSGTDREYGPSENVLVPAALPQWHDTPLFVPVMRAYIVRQVSGPRCRDRLDSKELPASVRQFNTLVSRLDPARDQYRPISAEEVKPLRDDGTYTPHVFWRSTRAKEVLNGLKSLNFGDTPEKQTAPLTPEMSQRADRAQLALSRVVARETSIERYTAVLELLDSWKES